MLTKASIASTLRYFLCRVVHKSGKRGLRRDEIMRRLQKFLEQELPVPVAGVKCGQEACACKITQFMLDIWHLELFLDFGLVNRPEIYSESKLRGAWFWNQK